jgi:hypothetical protein
MPLTLISVSCMAKSDHAVHFEKESAHVLTPDRVMLFVVPERNGLYPSRRCTHRAPRRRTPYPCLPSTLHTRHSPCTSSTAEWAMPTSAA